MARSILMAAAATAICLALGLGSAAATIHDRFDAILLGDAVAGARAHASNVILDDFNVDDVARNAVSALDVEKLTVRSGLWKDCRNSGLDVEPNLATQRALSVVAEDVTVDNAGSLAFVFTPGSAIRGVVYPDQMEGATLRDCTIYGRDNTDQGILFENWLGAKVFGGEIHGCREFGVHVKSSQDILINGSSVSDMVAVATCQGYGVHSDGGVQSSNVRLIGCTGYNLQGYGVQITDLDGGVLAGCLLDDYDNGAGGRDGVRIDVQIGGMDFRRIILVGVVATNGANSRGININSTSFTD
jgi:hypothetical protein